MKSLTLLLLILTQNFNIAYSNQQLVQRHKRQFGSNVYLPESFIIPGGEGTESEWGPWGTPSECSRTCGGGVAYSTRECLIIERNGNSSCQGGIKKYFSCNTQDCPESEPDFRHQQCSNFDRTPFENVYYTWVPYTKVPKPCELNCMPRGERFYYRHKSKVSDGTRCNDQSVDVCVDGECQPVGCDLILGSLAREDKCRKCQGHGTSCKTFTGLLDTNNLQVGYNDILLIPKGATNINIQERSPSNNYIAIRNLTGHNYLNGNYKIDFPRPMTFAGSLWTYERKPNGFAAPDKISCLGPITEAIYIMLLSQDKNVGVNYEYSIPRAAASQEDPEIYSWAYTKFKACSKSCGGGHQSRNVSCTKQRTSEQVDDSLCDSSQKPAVWQQCGLFDCAPEWVEGEWSKCSAPCGQNGTRDRKVHCERVKANGSVTVVDDDICFELAGYKPATNAPCNGGKFCPMWFTSKWQSCNKLCDAGKQTRQVICIRIEDDGRISVSDGKDCQDEKPVEEKECLIHPCEGVEFMASTWSGCDVPGTTTETRAINCVSKSGKIYDEKYCEALPKPALSRSCISTNDVEFQEHSSTIKLLSTQMQTFMNGTVVKLEHCQIALHEQILKHGQQNATIELMQLKLQSLDTEITTEKSKTIELQARIDELLKIGENCSKLATTQKAPEVERLRNEFAKNFVKVDKQAASILSTINAIERRNSDFRKNFNKEIVKLHAQSETSIKSQTNLQSKLQNVQNVLVNEDSKTITLLMFLNETVSEIKLNFSGEKNRETMDLKEEHLNCKNAKEDIITNFRLLESECQVLRDFKAKYGEIVQSSLSTNASVPSM